MLYGRAGWRVLTLSRRLFQDRHVKDASRDPQMDSSQDYRLLLGYENKTHTVLRFSRRYDTCDPRDLKITVGDAIYAARDFSAQAQSAREIYAARPALFSPSKRTRVSREEEKAVFARYLSGDGVKPNGSRAWAIFSLKREREHA